MIYGFKQRFVAPILAGTKTGTIRAPRAGRQGHARPGMALQLKHGPRMRPVFFADTVCTRLDDVSLMDMGKSSAMVLVREVHDGPMVMLYETAAALDSFARGDGFADWEDLCAFWQDTHQTKDFHGAWIQWAGAEVNPR